MTMGSVYEWLCVYECDDKPIPSFGPRRLIEREASYLFHIINSIFSPLGFY